MAKILHLSKKRRQHCEWTDDDVNKNKINAQANEIENKKQLNSQLNVFSSLLFNFGVCDAGRCARARSICAYAVCGRSCDRYWYTQQESRHRRSIELPINLSAAKHTPSRIINS